MYLLIVIVFETVVMYLGDGLSAEKGSSLKNGGNIFVDRYTYMYLVVVILSAVIIAN